MDILGLMNLRLCVTILEIDETLSEIERVYNVCKKENESLLETFTRLAHEKVYNK